MFQVFTPTNSPTHGLLNSFPTHGAWIVGSTGEPKKKHLKKSHEKNKNSHDFEDEITPQQQKSIKTLKFFINIFHFLEPPVFFPSPQNTFSDRDSGNASPRWQWIRCFIYIWVSSLPRIRGTRFRGWFLTCQGLKGDGFLSLVTGFLLFFFRNSCEFFSCFWLIGMIVTDS